MAEPDTAAPCCGRHNGTMACAQHPAGCCENCPDHPEHRQPTTAATDGPDRTLTFTLEISTVLGPTEQAQPAISYVADWLNDNDYDYREIGQHTVEDRATWVGDIP